MILSLLLLVGWGKKNVELLNDKKLIDLNVAIGLCMPGADTLDSRKDTTHTDEPEDEKSQTYRDSTEDEEKTIVIRIRGQKVTYDSVWWNEPDRLEDRIREDYGDKVLFRIVDDYAESHVYRRVKGILSELKSEIGLVYTEE